MRIRPLPLLGLLLGLLAGYVGYGAWSPGGAAAADCTNSQVYTLNHSPFAAGDVPVLFVHGITSSPATWTTSELTTWTTSELNGAASISKRVGSIPGTTVWAFDYHQWSEDWVNDSTIGPALAKAITCLASATGKRVILIAHSMGGLATQFAAARRDGNGTVGDRIAEVITLGTPYKGSKLLTVAQAAVKGGEDLADPEVAATVEALLSACAGISEAQLVPGNDNPCSIFSVLRAPIGSALEYDSAQIAALPAWSPQLAVKDIDGNIDINIDIFGLYHHTFDIGDIAVSPDSATAHNTDGTPDNVTCPNDAIIKIVKLGSVCYHSHLPRNSDVVNYVVSLVSRLVARQRPAPPKPTTTTGPPPTTTSTPPPTTTTSPAPTTTQTGSAPSCIEWLQMSLSARYAVVASMQAAHHDTFPLGVAYGSVRLFCAIHPNYPIDGVYNGSL